MEQYKIEKEKIENSILQMIRDNEELDIYGLLNSMLSWLQSANIKDFKRFKAYDNDNYDLGCAFGNDYLVLAKAIHKNSQYNPDKELFIICDDNIISVNQDEYNEMILSSRDNILNGYINKFGFDKSIELIEYYTH